MIGFTQASPGQWRDWTPVVTAAVPAGADFAYTINSARVCKVGRTVFVSYHVTLTNLGSGPAASGLISTTLPYAPNKTGAGSGAETGVSGKGMSVQWTGGVASATLRLADAGVTAVLNAQHRFSVSYEASA